MRDKIYEVLDIAEISHNIKNRGSDPTLFEKKELMNKAKSVKESKLSVTIMS